MNDSDEVQVGEILSLIHLWKPLVDQHAQNIHFPHMERILK
jgi:hypothetical protein